MGSGVRFLFLFSIGLLVSANLASATVTIKAGDARPVVSDGTNNYLHYGVIGFSDTSGTVNSNLASQPVDTHEGFYPILDVTKRPDLVNTNTYTPYIYLTVSSSTAKATSGTLLLYVKVLVTGGTYERVPIAYVGSTQCDSSICQESVLVDGITYYKNYRYSAGTTVTLAISPWEICKVITNATGCTSGIVSPMAVAASSGSIVYMELTPEFNTAADQSSAPNGTMQDSAKIIVRFQVDSPALVCPGGGTNPSQIFYPGDGQIFIDLSSFSIKTTGMTALSTGRAPLNAVHVVAKKGALGATSVSVNPSTMYDSNDIWKVSTSLTSDQAIDGFQNSTSSEYKYYSVSFVARDAAGMLAPPVSGATPDATQCVIKDVITADIQGFLARGKCFIASAAFRDTDAAPVAMLREFRSQILMKSALGRTLVRAYYKNSYEPAWWLMENPLFRGPVLLALFPLQCFAWLALHPLILVLLVMGTFAIAARVRTKE